MEGRRRRIRAGLPTATTLAGRSLVTTLPAPTTVFTPMVTPGSTVTLPPSHTLSPRTMGAARSQSVRRSSGARGWMAV